MNAEVRDAEIISYCRQKRSELLAPEFTKERSRDLEFVDHMEEQVFERLEAEARAAAARLAEECSGQAHRRAG